MIAKRQQFLSRVVANVPLCREHYRLVLEVDDFPPTQPGQFVQVACAAAAAPLQNVEIDWNETNPPPRLGGGELSRPTALLRRPFSLADRIDTDSHVHLHLVHRVVGIGTNWMANLKPHDHVSIIGPLGNTFTPPPPGSVALLVGGGVGIPPMMYLARRLAGTKAVVFAGALTRQLLPLTITTDAPHPAANDVSPLYNIAEFSRHGIPAIIATDDGSYGYRGYVTQALEAYLQKWFGPGSAGGRRPDAAPTIYVCGPESMMKRVAEIAANFSLACQIAVERKMACGMGTCQSCVIRVKVPGQTNGAAWQYKLACTDGPVFSASELLW